MSKAKHDTHCPDSELNAEHEVDEMPAQKKRRILEADGVDLQLQLEFPEAEQEERELSHLEFKSTPVDEDAADLQSQEGAEGKDFSQNKNPSLWCTAGTQEPADSFWDVASSKSYDHAVDDPLFWGPYLSERQWGTVREDYSDNDNCWEHVSYENATHHTYVSGEDGLLGVSDKCQILCASMALWNGKDPILKERLFGLTGIEGNHGEDVKELYYYLDNLPDHSYMRALYKYPQTAFPYKWLREENKNRTYNDVEFELIDTGVFEVGGHWDVTVEYVKTDHLGLACHIEVANNGRHTETLHLIPQFWFRHVQRNEPIPCSSSQQGQPIMKASSDGTVKLKYCFGGWRLRFMSKIPDNPTLLFTENMSAPASDASEADLPIFTKDAFHKYVVQGMTDAVNPLCAGTKCGAHYRLEVAAGAKASVYWKIESCLHTQSMELPELRNLFTNKRKAVQTYYNNIMPGWTLEERNIGIQAIAGLLWSKQYYCFDVRSWLADYRRCRANRGTKGRNYEWSHVHNHHILLMPDKWEFPWYAGWDLSIAAVLMSRFSSKFAKNQMTTFLSDSYMHPKGQLPGCEFEMGDPNPPLQPWAVLRIYFSEGANDLTFLRKCFHRLLFNYTWWCSKEYDSTNTYGRGFMGMDNISVIDRSGPLPQGWSLVQADFTGWMACYCLWMLQIAVELSEVDLVYCDLVYKFLEHFFNVAVAMNKPIAEKGLWHEEDRFFYDVLHTPEGPVPIQLRTMSGLVPLLACIKIKLGRLSNTAVYFDRFLSKYPQHVCRLNSNEVFLSVLSLPRVQSVLDRVFSEEQFLGPYGIRSMSKEYEAQPYSLQVGQEYFTVKYTPGESDSGVFGGNSNWRGPVWIFLNYLLLDSLDKYVERAQRSNATQVLAYPNPRPSTPSPMTASIADLETRLLSIFLPDAEGNRPIHGAVSRYATDPKWRHLVLFYEFIHADTGRGCGASHQTGWTAAIVEIIYRMRDR